MAESLNKKMTLWKAFLIILWQGDVRVYGKSIAFKRPCFYLALALTFFAPIQLSGMAGNYSGAMPPEAPIIKSTGIFVQKIRQDGLKQRAYVEFLTDNGDVYICDVNVCPGVLQDLGRYVPPMKVYAEGFLLRNGVGSYWPLVVMSMDGRVVISREALGKILVRSRDPMTAGKFIYPFGVLFWMISIFSVIQLKRKFS